MAYQNLFVLRNQMGGLFVFYRTKRQNRVLTYKPIGENLMSHTKKTLSERHSSPSKLSKAVVASLLAGSAVASINTQAGVPDQPKSWEKCAGIAAAGKNDCGSMNGSHDCAGQSSKDNDANEWVYVPAGTCEKIVGGKVIAVKPAKKKKG